jgi:uncharacterized protein YggU (UPF0235/DUF167 family)
VKIEQGELSRHKRVRITGSERKPAELLAD